MDEHHLSDIGQLVRVEEAVDSERGFWSLEKDILEMCQKYPEVLSNKLVERVPACYPQH